MTPIFALKDANGKVTTGRFGHDARWGEVRSTVDELVIGELHSFQRDEFDQGYLQISAAPI